MLVRGATLEGASTGVEFYMNPDFSRLGDLKVSHITYDSYFESIKKYFVTENCHFCI